MQLRVIYNRNSILIFLLFIAGTLSSQDVIKLGKASYAEYPPAGVENLSAYRYSYKELKNKYPFYLHENMHGQPVPTNDWWTDAIFSQYAGEMWAYPQGVSADSTGIKIIYPDGFDDGKICKTNFLDLKGSTDSKIVNFTPHSAKPYNWGDLNMLFRCEDDNNNFIDVTISHGSPFVWLELNRIKPVLTPSAKAIVYNADGVVINSFPAKGSAFSIQINNKYYGVHVPNGTTISLKDSSYFLNNSKSEKYVVISVLPNNSFLKTYDSYARNKLTNTTFEYAYNVEKGQISTTFVTTTENLDTKAKGNATLMSFQPHHYRTTTTPVNFIDGADYILHTGKMHTAIGNKFTFNYAFTGMPPHLGKPQNMTGEQTERLNQMVNEFKLSKYGENTYNKTLDELSEIMLIARQIDHPNYEHIKKTLTQTLIKWLTYDETEAQATGLFFARYPQYGALIGFMPGYDSQAFNDQHFHYGYYVLSAARLMMVDEAFKTDYAEMIKLIAKNYANWERWDGFTQDQKLPFLRTFDPYTGHSWASGMSYALGSDQESTSEAVMSWFGLLNLGLALNDTNIIALGAMGYKLESETTLEYYFDFYGDNFPETYKHKYVGILRSGAIMHDTWFSQDPAWIFGIQSVPSAHYCSYLSRDNKQSEAVMMSAIQERVNVGLINTTDIYTNIVNMGSQLGFYNLGYYANFNPKGALALQDKLFENESGEWKWSSQAAINYYLTNANISYGKPVEGYHTSLPGAAVYENNNGDITYLIYNHTNKDQEVNIYEVDKIIDTIAVKAGEFYCKKLNLTSRN